MDDMNQSPFVSIIVPTINRETVLVETLESVKKIDYPSGSWEVLVVDQTAKHEDSVESYLKKATWLQWFRPPEISFTSASKARNFGVERASKKAELFLFLDDDIELEPDFITQHVAGYVDDSVGATMGGVIDQQNPNREPGGLAGHISWWGRFSVNFESKEQGFIDDFGTGNCSIRADVLKKTGMFDEEFVSPGSLREDSDLALRVRELGLKIHFLPKAAVLHKRAPVGGTRSQVDRIEWYFAWFHNSMLFYAKHVAAWRLPFLVVSLSRPILACWLWYGKGSLRAFLRPWQGIRSGLAAAARSKKNGEAVVSQKVYQVF
jgi:GT2 family glycosyltransferase